MRGGKIALLLAGFVGAAQGAELYRYVDARGVLHLTNQPPQTRTEYLDIPEAYRQPGQRGFFLGNRPPAAPPSPPPQVLSVQPYAREIALAAAQAGLDDALVHAVVEVESAYQADIVSPKGALGLMQLMPGTAQHYGVADRSDPIDNLRAGTRYLKDLLQRFEGDLSLALAAYNAGAQAVVKHGQRIPPYAETQAYVGKVLERYQWHQQHGVKTLAEIGD